MLGNQQRLEPLVQRHQKLNRIAVRDSNAGHTDEYNLERIDEARDGMRLMAQPQRAGGSVSNLNRRAKPFSANQHNSKKRQFGGAYDATLPDNRGVASSTHYTSDSLSKPGSRGNTSATGANFFTKKYGSSAG